ncbi:serine/threonine protein kinase [Mucilaginibacter sp.]
MSRVFTIAEGLENLGAMKTGGQGSVYKGRRKAEIYTAVKLLPTPVLNQDMQDKNYSNFQNEVDKLRKVNEQGSPYVVKILSSGLTESGSFPYIEMEYIEGPDLSELLQDPHPKVFSVREVIKLADQLASALAHCHRIGVQHGDIKSNNVRYNTRSGNYVLLDFGLALMSEEQRRTSLRHAGAIEFMAPEQSRGEMLPQTDIYSYGIILYELLAGQVPFPLADHSEAARNQVMLAHMEMPVPELTALRENHINKIQQLKEARVPGWLLAVIGKCLRKDPKERYANGIELQEAVMNGNLAAAEAALSGTVAVPQSSASLPAAATPAGLLALQQENGRLQTQISQFKQEKADAEQQRIADFDTSKVSMSKPVFAGLVTLLLVFMLFSSYALFFKGPSVTPGANNIDTSSARRPSTTTDTTIQAESNYSTPDREAMRQAASDTVQKVIEEAKQAERNEQERKRREAADSVKREETDTTTISPPSDRSQREEED